MEPGTASRSIHNHFFLFKSAAILLYFCAILASFKKELKFKSKDIFLSISQKYFVCKKKKKKSLKMFCCLWSLHQENRQTLKTTNNRNLGLVFYKQCIPFLCWCPLEGNHRGNHRGSSWASLAPVVSPVGRGPCVPGAAVGVAAKTSAQGTATCFSSCEWMCSNVRLY